MRALTGAPVRPLSRWLGVGACVAPVPLWALFALTASGSEGGLSGPTVGVVATMLLLAAAGGVAAWRSAPDWMALVGLASLVPVGFYLLLGEGPTRWIGACNLGLLAAAAVAGFDRRRRLRALAGQMGTFSDFMTQDDLRRMREEP